METKLDEVYVYVTSELTKRRMDDTPENRLTLLTELREEWLDDGTVSFVKWLYLITINNETNRLREEIANSHVSQGS